MTREQWLDHGLAQLADHGPTMLKADKLAKSLGVSRGSFYWHFADLATFHEATIARWLELTVTEVIASLDPGLEASARLRQLVELVVGSADHRLERAVRAWSLSDGHVAAMVHDVDQRRLAYIESCLVEIGVGAGSAAARAHFIYSGSVGHVMLGRKLSKPQASQLTQAVMDLAAAL